jgi:tRNA pseudouridine38-40 synthase
MIQEKTIHLTIAYDGTGFSGWQRQPCGRTVCGELEKLLSGVCGIPVELFGASRTDAGVHARGQSASFTGLMGIPATGIARAANDALSPSRLERAGEIQILSALEKPAGFHARYDAKGKRYAYRIRNAPRTDLFLRNYCYQVTAPLDAAAMQEAASVLVGEQDFRCFLSAGGNPQKTTVRRIDGCQVQRDGEDILLTISGTGFLYHMVRNIAGTLVEVGAGKRPPGEMKQILESRDRSRAGHTAPPQGLYLDEVFY